MPFLNRRGLARNRLIYFPKRQQVLSPLGKIFTGSMILTITSAVAVFGYWRAGWSVSDGIYMVVITIFGVGYGEVHPVESGWLRIMTIALIVIGSATTVYTVGGFVQLLIDGEFNRLMGTKRMQREIEKLQGHTIICGFGRMGSMLAHALATRSRPFVIVDTDKARVEEARCAGYMAIQGDATQEDALKEAGVERAATLATVLGSDVNNVFITITARELHPQLQILARAEQASTTKKLRQVGASRVILPAAIGADRFANMILRPTAESLLQQAKLPEGLNEDLATIGLRLDELEVEEESKLCGGKIKEIHVRGHRGFLIVAIRRHDGSVVLNPNGNETIQKGDCLIVLGHHDDIPELCSRYTLRSEALG